MANEGKTPDEIRQIAEHVAIAVRERAVASIEQLVRLEEVRVRQNTARTYALVGLLLLVNLDIWAGQLNRLGYLPRAIDLSVVGLTVLLSSVIVLATVKGEARAGRAIPHESGR